MPESRFETWARDVQDHPDGNCPPVEPLTPRPSILPGIQEIDTRGGKYRLRPVSLDTVHQGAEPRFRLLYLPAFHDPPVLTFLTGIYTGAAKT